MAINFELTVEVKDAGTLAFIGMRDVTEEVGSSWRLRHLEKVIAVLFAFVPSGPLAECRWENRLSYLMHGVLNKLKAARPKEVSAGDKHFIFFECHRHLHAREVLNPTTFLEATAVKLLEEMQEARDVEQYLQQRGR